MEFIKAFLLFMLFVLIMGVVLFIVAYIIYFIILSLMALKRKIKQQTPYYIKPLKPTIKFIKIISTIYILSCLCFYILRANEYLLKDRPYKEAKAYAIAGEYLQTYQVLIGTFKTADTFYYRALQYLQRELTLKNIYRLIPESDAEREIWNYKFQQYIYARSFWGPVIQPNVRKNFGLLHWAASFEPWMKDLINNIYTSIINLDTLPIKDEKFSKIDRYLVIASMAPYYERYFTQEINPEYEDKDGFGVKGSRTNTYFTTPFYINKLNTFLRAVDNTKEAMDNNKEVSYAFNDNPTIKALLYWAGVKMYAQRNRADAYTYRIYICNTNNLDKYVEYQGDFLDWTNESFSSFRKLSKDTKDTYKFMINDTGLHYTAKYICGKKFKSYSYEEEFSLYHVKKEDLKKDLDRRLLKGSRGELQKLVQESRHQFNNNTKENTNGTR